jgi:hypothetical protein
MNKEFRKLCTPAKIYFAIAVISSIIALFSGVRLIAVMFKLLFGFIWTFILAWLCKRGLTVVSWWLVLLPYIIIFLAMFKLYHLTDEQKKLVKSLQLEGPIGQEGMSSHKRHHSRGKHHKKKDDEEVV